MNPKWMEKTTKWMSVCERENERFLVERHFEEKRSLLLQTYLWAVPLFISFKNERMSERTKEAILYFEDVDSNLCAKTLRQLQYRALRFCIENKFSSDVLIEILIVCISSTTTTAVIIIIIGGIGYSYVVDVLVGTFGPREIEKVALLWFAISADCLLLQQSIRWTGQMGLTILPPCLFIASSVRTSVCLFVCVAVDVILRAFHLSTSRRWSVHLCLIVYLSDCR